MKQVKHPGALIKWKGNKYEVIGIIDGLKTLILEETEKTCPYCDKKRVAVVERSPEFQDNAEAIDTLEDL